MIKVYANLCGDWVKLRDDCSFIGEDELTPSKWVEYHIEKRSFYKNECIRITHKDKTYFIHSSHIQIKR